MVWAIRTTAMIARELG
ncbi:antirestriction Ral family protein [Escherichia coli]|nr:antirestriction Ral family protein [Escherichia coli]